MHKSLDLSFFFAGTMRKEEVASSLAAMLFDARRDFRVALFRVAGWTDAGELADLNWETNVEVDMPGAGRIDMRMESDTSVCLIENKIKSGAKQPSQLLKYYLAELELDHNKRILAIYLAPGTMGVDEVEKVASDHRFQARSADRAGHVSWQQLAKFTESLTETDRDFGVVTSGFQSLLKTIAADKLTKYPAEGVRALVLEIATSSRSRLQALHPAVPLRPWRLPNGEQILNSKSPVTLWLDITFEPGDDPDNVGSEVIDGDKLRLRLTSQFKLAGKIKKGEMLGLRWKEQIAEGRFAVPNVGTHALRGDGWFWNTFEVEGTIEEIATVVANTGDAVLSALDSWCA